MNETKIIPIDYLHYSTLNALRFILYLNNNILYQTKFMESNLKKIYSKFNNDNNEESKKEKSLFLNFENKGLNNYNVYEEFLKLKNSYNGKHFFKVFYRQSKK